MSTLGKHRYWDLRSPNAVHVHQLPERCYALSLNFPLLVVGTAERHIEIFNVQTAPQQVYKKLVSPLKYQTRYTTAFPNRTGYVALHTLPHLHTHTHSLSLFR